MFKAILLFIKTHAVATAITTTVVVGTTVATPIIVDNIKLDNMVKENLNMLVSSNFEESNNTNETASDTETAEDNQQENANTNEPLTFRVVEVKTKTEGGKIVKDMQGNDAYEMSSENVEYKIVPSYDKDYSKWTKAEKEAYQKAYEDAAKMAEERYKNNVANDKQILENLQKEFEKEETSWSEYYTCVSGSVAYNSYTKKYKGTYTSKIIETVHDDGQHTYDYNTEFFGNVSADEFRNVIYPIMLQTYAESKKMGLYVIPEEEELYRANLEKVYHLSD